MHRPARQPAGQPLHNTNLIMTHFASPVFLHTHMYKHVISRCARSLAVRLSTLSHWTNWNQMTWNRRPTNWTGTDQLMGQPMSNAYCLPIFKDLPLWPQNVPHTSLCNYWMISLRVSTGSPRWVQTHRGTRQNTPVYNVCVTITKQPWLVT